MMPRQPMREEMIPQQIDNTNIEHAALLQSTPPPHMKIPGSPTQDFFWFRLNSDDIIESVTHQLRGEVESIDDKGQLVYKKMFDAWCNEEGIAKIIYIMYACGINKSTVLGCLTHDEINMKCQSIWREIARLFAFEYSRYGVKKENRSILIKSVVYPIHSALSRSEQGRESDQLSTAAQRVEHIMNKPEAERKNSLNPFGMFGRR